LPSGICILLLDPGCSCDGSRPGLNTWRNYSKSLIKLFLIIIIITIILLPPCTFHIPSKRSPQLAGLYQLKGYRRTCGNRIFHSGIPGSRPRLLSSHNHAIQLLMLEAQAFSSCLCYRHLRNVWPAHRWLTPVILATQEAEIRRIAVQSQANSS
jgi:hypothetical protein